MIKVMNIRTMFTKLLDLAGLVRHMMERGTQNTFLVQRGKQTLAGLVSDHLRIAVGIIKGLRVSSTTSVAARGWTTPTTTFRGGFRARPKED